MSGITLSNIVEDYEGDFNCGRGQQGFTSILTLTSNITLWTTVSEKPRRCVFTPSGADRTVTLPVIGTALTEAQPGHIITIVNSGGGSNDIVVHSSAAVQVGTNITDGSQLTVVANTAPATWTVSLDSSVLGGLTLQTAYNNGDGSITLDNTNNAVNIIGATNDPAQSLFTINNNDSSETYFSIKNITTTSYTPALQALGGTASNTGSLAIGDSTTATDDNAMIFGDGTIAADTTSADRFHLAFGEGIQQVAGATPPGTIDTSPNFTRIQGKFQTTDAAFNVFTDLAIATVDNTTYEIRVKVVCSSDGAASGATSGSAMYLQVGAHNDGGTLVILGQRRQRIRGSGHNVNIRAAVSTTTLNIEVQGIAATTIDWLGNMEIQQFTFDPTP